MKAELFLLVLSINVCCYAQNESADSTVIKRKAAEIALSDAKMQMQAFEKSHGHFIQTPNGKVHYLTYGNPRNVPLVWCGGSGMNAYELIMFGDTLESLGYYLITLDYYGQGQTPIPNHEVSLWDIADDIKAILNELKIKKTIIGGWSRGGTIATVFYDAYPEKVLGIILEDGGSVSWNAADHKLPVAEIERKTLERFKNETPDPRYQSELELFQSFRLRGMYHTFFVLNGVGQDSSGKWGERIGLNALYCEDNAEHKLKITLRTMDAPLYAASAQLVEPRIIYRNLDVPMVIFDPVMENDMFRFTEGNTTLYNQHPDLIEHKIYENTPHHLKFSKRDRFISDMSNFLIRVKKFHKL